MILVGPASVVRSRCWSMRSLYSKSLDSGQFSEMSARQVPLGNMRKIPLLYVYKKHVSFLVFFWPWAKKLAGECPHLMWRLGPGSPNDNAVSDNLSRTVRGALDSAA